MAIEINGPSHFLFGYKEIKLSIQKFNSYLVKEIIGYKVLEVNVMDHSKLSKEEGNEFLKKILLS